MNTIEIIFSPTGGTERVARIISGRWNRNTVMIDLCDAQRLTAVVPCQRWIQKTVSKNGQSFYPER